MMNFWPEKDRARYSFSATAQYYMCFCCYPCSRFIGRTDFLAANREIDIYFSGLCPTCTTRVFVCTGLHNMIF